MPSKAVDRGEWVGQAWALWVAGERNLTALGKQFGKKAETVKKALTEYSAARAAEVASTDATAEYLDGLEHDMREALRTYRTAENPNAKVGALKHATACREKLAAAKGVVTERKNVELTGSGGGALQVEHEGGALEQLTSAIARLATRGDAAAGTEEPDA